MPIETVDRQELDPELASLIEKAKMVVNEARKIQPDMMARHDEKCDFVQGALAVLNSEIDAGQEADKDQLKPTISELEKVIKEYQNK